MHELLRKQIRSCLGENPHFSEELASLIESINEAYEKNETDKVALENHINYISAQLDEINQELGDEKYERLLAELQLKTFDGFHEVTGLVNRNTLKDRITLYLSLAKRLNKPLAVLHIGIDNFRLVNELVGIAAGDRILKTAANLLKACCREGDTLAHFSGDEFILVLSPVKTTEEVMSLTPGHIQEPFNCHIESVVQRIQRAISEPISLENQVIQVTCSIGICVYPRDGQHMDDLLKHSNAALILAKSLGKNNHQFYTAGANEKVTEKLLLYAQLWRAIAHSELELHYQPQVDLTTGAIVGAEALIRWNHPERGLLLPNEFIPLAEETDLILSIDEWVLNKACSQIRYWKENGFGDLRIAINVSAKQFVNSAFVESISMAIAKGHIKPQCLDIEITESHVIKNVEQAIIQLNRIKGLGIQLSIDDFGTGYSNLSYLKRFPVDVLKIDQSFVCDIAVNTEGAVICKAIISMAHNLGLRVIAEGVETEAQCHFLSKNLCDEVQGFLFSKSLTVCQMESLLLENRKLPSHLLRFYDSPRTLLLVDDDPKNINAMKRIFRRDNYRILTAGNGCEGLSIVNQHQVDVIVTDYRMPLMNGVEFLTIVKSKHPDIVRIMLTGQADMQALMDAVNEGAVFQILTKPCSDTQLKLHVAEAFRRNEQEAASQRSVLEMQMVNRVHTSFEGDLAIAPSHEKAP